jgi:mono/diheme cytochrome c family protein
MDLHWHGRLVLAALLAGGPSFAQIPEDGLTSRQLGIRAEIPESRSELLERGEQVYEYWCQTCHGPEPLKPGTAALQAKYGGAIPAPLTQRTDLTPAFVKLMVRQGVSMMPFFRPTEISDADLEALAAYLAATQ